jgi:hypothetical protein
VNYSLHLANKISSINLAEIGGGLDKIPQLPESTLEKLLKVFEEDNRNDDEDHSRYWCVEIIHCIEKQIIEKKIK